MIISTGRPTNTAVGISSTAALSTFNYSMGDWELQYSLYGRQILQKSMQTIKKLHPSEILQNS